MPLSIDSFWLMTVLQNGYLALLPLCLAFFISMRSYWAAWRLKGELIYFLFFISLFSIVFAGFTVDFFDRAQLMVFFMMGDRFSSGVLGDVWELCIMCESFV